MIRGSSKNESVCAYFFIAARISDFSRPSAFAADPPLTYRDTCLS
jgi:hypothetical protein|tara:strand:- start:6786 stop:6920 length:135 start_codon:yes stop_codon:yes gene_type:complete